ncbi:MAG: hypothetical protein ABSE84_26470, partial [Isosphaeraceae bacterium]
PLSEYRLPSENQAFDKPRFQSQAGTWQDRVSQYAQPEALPMAQSAREGLQVDDLRRVPLLRADPRRILQAPRHLQSATYRDALKAVRTQDLHRELKTRLESLYPHWEFAVESNW